DEVPYLPSGCQSPRRKYAPGKSEVEFAAAQHEDGRPGRNCRTILSPTQESRAQWKQIDSATPGACLQGRFGRVGVGSRRWKDLAPFEPFGICGRDAGMGGQRSRL